MRRRNRFPNATAYADVRGKRRWRHRKNGKSTELGTDYGSEEFIRRYEAAVRGAKITGDIGSDQIQPGTVDDLVTRFYTLAFAGDQLAKHTKDNYRQSFERFRKEHGHKRVKGLELHHIEVILAEMADRPSASNNLRKRLAKLFDLAVRLKWLPANPVRQTKSIKTEGSGFHTWTEIEIDRYYAVHKPGTLPHRAMTLMLYTGAAKVDAVQLGWSNIKQTRDGERLQYIRQKTRRTSSPVIVSIKILPELRAVLDTCPREHATFLQTARGEQRSPDGLGNQMRKWCDEAGLPECTSHGLRKAIARRLAEAGATAPQIAAVTGHKTLAEVQRYIEEASRKSMADEGLDRLSNSLSTTRSQNGSSSEPQR